MRKLKLNLKFKKPALLFLILTGFTQAQETQKDYTSLPPQERLRIVNTNLEAIQKVKRDFDKSKKIPVDDCCKFNYQLTEGATGFALFLASGYVEYELNVAQKVTSLEKKSRAALRAMLSPEVVRIHVQTVSELNIKEEELLKKQAELGAIDNELDDLKTELAKAERAQDHVKAHELSSQLRFRNILDIRPRKEPVEAAISTLQNEINELRSVISSTERMHPGLKQTLNLRTSPLQDSVRIIEEVEKMGLKEISKIAIPRLAAITGLGLFIHAISSSPETNSPELSEVTVSEEEKTELQKTADEVEKRLINERNSILIELSAR